MLIENVEEVVRELNIFLYDVHNETEYSFSYETNGFVQLITIADLVIYNSEDNDLNYNKETDEYEDLTLYIKRKFNERIDNLLKLRF